MPTTTPATHTPTRHDANLHALVAAALGAALILAAWLAFVWPRGTEFEGGAIWIYGALYLAIIPFLVWLVWTSSEEDAVEE